MKHLIIFIFLIISLSFSVPLQGHGFGQDTWVKMHEGSRDFFRRIDSVRHHSKYQPNAKVYQSKDIIGASKGKETPYMVVKCSANTIHGHPITKTEYLRLISCKNKF